MLLRFFQRLSYDEALSQRQRWSHYLTLLFGGLALLLGTSLRDNALFAAREYVNPQAGIRAFYPLNWLLDEEGSYVFRARDVARPGFQTTLQVSVVPVTEGTEERNILDGLTLARAQTLAAYEVLTIEPVVLPDDSLGTRVLYVYNFTDADPFLQGIPVAVQGMDILTIKRGQAIIITFLSDALYFDDNLPVFERFLETLEF